MKTTKKDFELYCEEVQKWMGIFGLNDWQLLFEYGTDGDEDIAQVEMYTDSRMARFRFAIEWDAIYPKDDDNISRCAFHEVVHVLLGDLERFVPRECNANWSREMHKVIAVLENVIWANAEV